MRILFTANNFIQKAILLGDLTGSTLGMLSQLTSESYLTQNERTKMQILVLVVSVPQILSSIKGVNNWIKELDKSINAIGDARVASQLRRELEAISRVIPTSGNKLSVLELIEESKALKMKYKSLTLSLKEQFLLDFMNANKDVLKAL